MTKHQHHTLAETVMTGTPSFEGLFWVDPERMGSINDVINSAADATVWLGAQSRAQHFVEERTAIKDAVSAGGSLSESGAYAVDVGYMYGTLLAGDDQPVSTLAARAKLPEGFVEDLTGIAASVHDDLYADYELFQKLRRLEVMHTGSDVIAFGLAAAQDHLGRVLTQRASDTPDTTQRMRLQNLAYTGVLAGALAVTDQDLPLPHAEIMRPMRPQGEVVAIRSGFTPTDAIADYVHHGMTHKRTFEPIRVGRKRFYGAVDGNYQFGPNMLSIPLFTPDYYPLRYEDVIPAKRVSAVVTRSVLVDEEGAQETSLRLVEGAASLNDIERTGDDSIAAVITRDGYVSGIDARHPWSLAIESMIVENVAGLSEEFQRVEMADIADSTKSLIRRRQRVVIPAALLPGVFMKDVVGYALLDDYSINWIETGATIAALGGMIGLAELLRATKQRHVREIDFVDAQIQAVLDNSTLRS